MSRDLFLSAIKTHLSKLLELDIKPEISDLARPSNNDIVIGTNDGFDLRISRALAVNIILIASGDEADQELDEATAENVRFAATEYLVIARILSELWYRAFDEVGGANVPLIGLRFEGLPGKLMVTNPIQNIEVIKESTHVDDGPVVDALRPLQQFLASLSRSQKTAQICKNLEHWTDEAMKDAITRSSIPVGSLILRFVSPERAQGVLSLLNSKLQDSLEKTLNNHNHKSPIDAMITSLAFNTYPPVGMPD